MHAVYCNNTTLNNRQNNMPPILYPRQGGYPFSRNSRRHAWPFSKQIWWKADFQYLISWLSYKVHDEHNLVELYLFATLIPILYFPWFWKSLSMSWYLLSNRSLWRTCKRRIWEHFSLPLSYEIHGHSLNCCSEMSSCYSTVCGSKSVFHWK